MRKILFLCTGNYYRSRFAEEYLNHYAVQLGLDWSAYSRGLAPDMALTGNVGPISSYTLKALEQSAIVPQAADRMPERVQSADFDQYDRIILMSKAEHEPMILAQFPERANQVEYFEVGDVGVERSADAMVNLTNRLEELIHQLQE